MEHLDDDLHTQTNSFITEIDANFIQALLPKQTIRKHALQLQLRS